MNKKSKIYIAGHKGMVGSALARLLNQKGYHNLIIATSKELDLRDQRMVSRFFAEVKPDYVFLAAAKVGGIYANNTFRADFLYDNLMIQANVIHSSFLNGVKKLLFLGSSCIYPKLAKQPLKEEYLLTGALEETNQPYAISKIAGIELCDSYRKQHGSNFISVMPANLYGPNDNYDIQNSHVLPALLRKFIKAKISQLPCVEVWGDGTPLREFLHVDDLAQACLFLMLEYDEPGVINVGSGEELTIKQLAFTVKKIVNYQGEIRFDYKMPNGTPRKILDSSRINKLGWCAKIKIEEGIRSVYSEIKNYNFTD
jgi:GDP-L-fucose synthase